MAEYIECSKLNDVIRWDNDIGKWTIWDSDLEALPSADVVEVKHGRWVDRYYNKYANHLYQCSECEEKALYRFEVDALGREIAVQDLSDYCPNCGARMDGE